MSNPGYTSSRLAVWRANWRDRLTGAHARANARMGYLRAPRGEGKVVWIKSGASRESVRLGVELLGALRHKRLDLRLALTFESDFADILEPRLSGLRKVGLGFGPCDLPRVARRTLQRFAPLGVVLADAYPSPHLLAAAAERGARLVAFNTNPAGIPVEAAYPVDERQERRWQETGLSGYLAPAADPLSLFAEAQVDVTLKSLMTGDQGELWWWVGARKDLPEFVSAWRESEISASGILLVSVIAGAEGNTSHTHADLPISAWARTRVAPGSVVWLDEPRWRPAVSSAVTGTHLDRIDRPHLWVGLAGGPALTASQSVLDEYPKLSPFTAGCADPQRTLEEWVRFRSEPISARRAGDRARRVVWEERRRVQSVLEEFLQRVFDW